MTALRSRRVLDHELVHLVDGAFRRFAFVSVDLQEMKTAERRKMRG